MSVPLVRNPSASLKASAKSTPASPPAKHATVVNGVLEGQAHDIDSLDNNIDDGMENSNEVAIAIASAAVVIQRPHLPLEQGVETQAICETPWIECGRVRNKSPLSIGGLIDD